MSGLAEIKEAWTNLPTWGKGAAVAGVGLLGYMLVRKGGGDSGEAVDGTYGIPTYSSYDSSGGGIPGTGGGSVITTPTVTTPTDTTPADTTPPQASEPAAPVSVTPAQTVYVEPTETQALAAAAPAKTVTKATVFQNSDRTAEITFVTSTNRKPTTAQVDAMNQFLADESAAKKAGAVGTSKNLKKSNSYVTYKPNGKVIVQDRDEWARDNPKQAAENAKLAAKPLSAADIAAQRKAIAQNPNISFGNKDIRKLGLY